MKKPDLHKVHRLVLVGQFAPALDMLEEVLSDDPRDLEALLMRIKTLRLGARIAEAKAAVEAAAPIIRTSGHKVALAELAFERGYVLMETVGLEEALENFIEAAETGGPNIEYYSAVCDTLGRLDRREESTVWRTKVLRMRDAEVRCAGEEVITAGRPKAFDPGRPERNIVSYCLFGSDPYYHECAVTNARVTPVMFPEFTARFYCAPDLPAHVLKALGAAGAQVMVAPAQGGAGVSPMAGTFWRFLTFDDPGVDVVLCRDVDSPILPRERAAIDLWLASDKPFYGLRDHPVHAELILAGMWGGFTGVLPPLGPLASEFIQTDHTRFADQRFLRTVIWPRLREHALLSIDSIASLEGSVDFPQGYHNHGRLHVGVSWTRSQILGKA